MAGRRIDRFMFWVPQSGDIGMGVSILSYDGAVQFGLITDRGLVPDPERVIAQFAPEFEKLVLTTLLSPWPRDGDLDPAVAAQAVGAVASSVVPAQSLPPRIQSGVGTQRRSRKVTGFPRPRE